MLIAPSTTIFGVFTTKTPCVIAMASIQLLFLIFASLSCASATFIQNFDITWGDQRAKVLPGGDTVQLTLDKWSGSGFRSKQEFLFTRIDMKIKLVEGNSAGTVTTYYLSSQGPNHDEIDFEFLGNVTGDPYVMHTNVFSQGKGNREVQFYLWFDPTKSFHTYSIIWNPSQIIFLVDGIPVRVFENTEATTGVPFPKNQPMRVYASLWNADDWATKGGLVKTNWSLAPFTASFSGFKATNCKDPSSSPLLCNSIPVISATTTSSVQAQSQSQPQAQLSANMYRRMRWVQRKYMIYSYCGDTKRFPQGLPPECRRRR
ncbi:hypothetical protein AMTRI_Chr12g239480 [Amborella trichopoda]